MGALGVEEVCVCVCVRAPFEAKRVREENRRLKSVLQSRGAIVRSIKRARYVTRAPLRPSRPAGVQQNAPREARTPDLEVNSLTL